MSDKDKNRYVYPPHTLDHEKEEIVFKEDKTEKVYITRDEDDNHIYVWRRPTKGNWSPQKLKNCDLVNWQREDISNMDIYLVSDFKKKFGMTIRARTKRCVRLPYSLLYNEDYKLISNDPNRKQ